MDEEEVVSETACGMRTRNMIYHRLRALGNEEAALSDPVFEQLLEEHFERLPASYGDLMKINREEEVLLHRRILADCEDPDKRPIFHARFLQSIQVQEEWPHDAVSPPAENGDAAGGSLTSGLSWDTHIHLHEIIFSSVDKPKLLCQETDGLLQQLMESKIQSYIPHGMV